MSEDSWKRAEEIREGLKRPKDISVARQIVAMLLKEERNNHRLLMEAIKRRDDVLPDSVLYERLDFFVTMSSIRHTESHNLAEIARRILYGTYED